MKDRVHAQAAHNAPLRTSIRQSTALGEVGEVVTRFSIRIDSAHHVPYEGSIAAARADFPQGFLASYGSGLALKGVNAAGDLEFYGLTERGPNGDGPNVPVGDATVGGKIFPSPGFNPSVAVITVGRNGAVLGAPMRLQATAGVPFTGLPIAPGSIGHAAEVPLFDEMKFDPGTPAVFDADGLDPEAIAVDTRRSALWRAINTAPSCCAWMPPPA